MTMDTITAIIIIIVMVIYYVYISREKEEKGKIIYGNYEENGSYPNSKTLDNDNIRWSKIRIINDRMGYKKSEKRFYINSFRTKKEIKEYVILLEKNF